VLGDAGRVPVVSDANNARTRFCMRSRFRIMDQSRGSKKIGTVRALRVQQVFDVAG
jgi:hypothetical protein